MWDMVAKQPLDGSSKPASTSLASSPFLKADSKQQDEKKAAVAPQKVSPANERAASLRKVEPVPIEIVPPTRTTSDPATPVLSPKSESSNLSIKEALGLVKCCYCSKHCYDGDGEQYEGKMYHTQFCLAKAMVLIKFANAEMELKHQPKKVSTPIDPIVNEILKTEETYLTDLGLIIEHFIKPCRESSVISDEDIKTVFCNIEKLKALHEIVVVGLHAEGKKPAKIQNWGLVFKTYEASFRSEYQAYTKNQSKARVRRVELEEDEKFKAFLTAALAHPDLRLLDLNSYLIKPVQRICKYPLLLRELNKAFDGMGIVNEEAKKDLTIAMGGMNEVLKKANDYMTSLRSTRSTPVGTARIAPDGNVCAFCKKPVHASERRMEDGLVYHAELCFSRERAATQLEKKSRKGQDDRFSVNKAANSLKVRRNPLIEQKERIAAKKAEKERARVEKERATTEKDDALKVAARKRADDEAERVRTEVIQVRAKLEKVRQEQDRLEVERAELERRAALGMPAPEPERTELQRLAAMGMPSPEREAVDPKAKPPMVELFPAEEEPAKTETKEPIAAESAPDAAKVKEETLGDVKAPEVDGQLTPSSGDQDVVPVDEDEEAAGERVVLTAAQVKEENQREVEVIMAAIDIEGELTAGDTPSASEPAAKAANTENASAVPAPGAQFSTLRGRRAAGEADDSAAAEVATVMPREVARTLRIVEEQRKVFSTIRSRQIKEDEERRSD